MKSLIVFAVFVSSSFVQAATTGAPSSAASAAVAAPVGAPPHSVACVRASAGWNLVYNRMRVVTRFNPDGNLDCEMKRDEVNENHGLGCIDKGIGNVQLQNVYLDRTYDRFAFMPDCVSARQQLTSGSYCRLLRVDPNLDSNRRTYELKTVEGRVVGTFNDEMACDEAQKARVQNLTRPQQTGTPAPAD